MALPNGVIDLIEVKRLRKSRRNGQSFVLVCFDKDETLSTPRPWPKTIGVTHSQDLIHGGARAH